MPNRLVTLILAASLAAPAIAAEAHHFAGVIGNPPSGTWGAGAVALVDGRHVWRIVAGAEGAQSSMRWPVPAETATSSVSCTS